MKMKLLLVSVVTLLTTAPLEAENVNGFENFKLYSNDFKSNPSSAIANFSSRTHTDDDAALPNFSSRKPIGFALKIR